MTKPPPRPIVIGALIAAACVSALLIALENAVDRFAQRLLAALEPA